MRKKCEKTFSFRRKKRFSRALSKRKPCLYYVHAPRRAEFKIMSFLFICSNENYVFPIAIHISMIDYEISIFFRISICRFWKIADFFTELVNGIFAFFKIIID